MDSSLIDQEELLEDRMQSSMNSSLAQGDHPRNAASSKIKISQAPLAGTASPLDQTNDGGDKTTTVNEAEALTAEHDFPDIPGPAQTDLTNFNPNSAVDMLKQRMDSLSNHRPDQSMIEHVVLQNGGYGNIVHCILFLLQHRISKFFNNGKLLFSEF